MWLVIRMIAIDRAGGPSWFRITIFIGSLFPTLLWICKSSLTLPRSRWSDILWDARWMALLNMPASILPWTAWFVPNSSNAVHPIKGDGYYVYVAWSAMLYAFICLEVVRQMRRSFGLALIELQVVVLAWTIMAFSILTRMAVDSLIPLAITKQSTYAVALFAAGWVGYFCFTHRIFDAHYLFRIAARYILLIGAVAVTTYSTYWMCSDNLPAWLTFILMAVVSLAVARWLNGRLDHWLFQFPAAAAARAAAHGAARTATTAEELRQEFERVVSGWAHAEKALFAAVVPHEPVETTEWSLATDDPVLGTLREIHWATPERLQRERSTPGRGAVRAFLTAHGLGAVVLGRGESVTVLMAVGLKPTRRPFTYPEIEQLIELAEIAEAALSRVRLTEQAVQREKLATLGLLGASLAHEIRNPLYAIRAFAELLPDNYDRTEFREQFAGMVGTEVVRIDQLISQLMNLAAPRKLSATTVRLHEVVREAMALVAPKARASGIAWETRLRAEDDCVHADRAATKQVLLNLCLNAIQAQENDGTAEGWVRVSTVDRADGVELTVSDGGPGIAEALRDRLFEPFQTTHAGGLGLGLSISREILAYFGATLNVDPPREDEGAVFHVVFQRSGFADTPEYDLRPAPACVI